MKSIIVTGALTLLAAFGAMGQSAERTAVPTMRCSRPGGRACTVEHTQALTEAVRSAAKGSRPGLKGVDTLTLASDGTLKCLQASGSPCTLEQAKLIRDVSAAYNVTITVSGGDSK